MRVSRLGGCTSAIMPQAKRERNRSSSRGIACGGRSLVSTICRLAVCSALKVWKNSSCVCSLPAMKCTSSISSTSLVRYLARNWSVDWVRMALMSSFVKSSDVT